MEKRTTTGIKKREKIQQANKTMFLWVVIASAAVAICLVLAQFLIRQMLFNQKVIGVKGQTNSTLVSNKKTFETIKSGVDKLISNNSLSSLKVAQTDTALQVVIDALPTSDDRAALATSLQQVVLSRSGAVIDSISVTDQSSIVTPGTAVAAPEVTTPQEIKFNFVLVGNYSQINQTISDMERCIRPFSIDRMQIEGNGSQLRASMSAKTYYLPAKTMSVKTEALKP